jgi:murein DD-endopeptidase MepM/ murein hydrolase activator NlpD
MHLKPTFLAAAFVVAATAGAQQSRLSFLPAKPAPGAIVRLTLETTPSSDSIVSISGTMTGEPLHFRKSGNGLWHAMGPVSVDATGSVRAEVFVAHASDAVDSVSATVELPKPVPAKRGAKRRALAVAPRFTRPMSAETEARIAKENETARAIGRHAHDTPPMWTLPFIRPRTSTITSRFGSGRMFNGTLSSRHLGVDFRGATGEAIRAANRGVVALVDNFYLAGNVVYIDHGGGVVTGYFHMSKPLVKAGDIVERGQEIGLIGATGRVTGPHLHWNARYGAVTVNPLDLLTSGRP